MGMVRGMSQPDILGFLLEALYGKMVDLGTLWYRYGLGYYFGFVMVVG